MKSVLTIAGSDPTGGAGLQADLRVFQCLGVHGAAVPSALTQQNGLRIRQVLPVFPSALLETLRETLETVKPAAVKIGMLATDDLVRNVTLALGPYPDLPVIIDPVLAASDGTPLLERRAQPALRDLIFGRRMLTPNWPEAEVLCGRSLDRKRDAEAAMRELLEELRLDSILLKGGHRERDADDLLVLRTDSGVETEWLEGERIPGTACHGTGCALSAAIAAEVALGTPLRDAVVRARAFVRRAIENAQTLENGTRLLVFS
jgi:hydroxymethylpyrimidine/phosphomethylpyrimidine kinase